jgi:hypothetical protein
MHAARPTLYAGVRMRSRLEASFAAHLDSLGFSWEYEPECFASTAGQWLPDFKCISVDVGPGPTQACYFEVKPMSAGMEVLNEVHVRSATVTRASDPDALVLIAIGDGWPVTWRTFVAGPGRYSDEVELLSPNFIEVKRPRTHTPTPLRPAPIDPVTGRAVLGGRARRAVKEAFPGADLSDDVDLSMLVDEPSGQRKT